MKQVLSVFSIEGPCKSHDTTWLREGFAICKGIGLTILSLIVMIPNQAAYGSNWNADFRFSWVNTLSGGSIIEESINPQNQTYRLPSALYQSALRPEFSLSPKSATRIILRPRLDWEFLVRKSEEPRQEDEFDLYLNEAYWAQSFSFGQMVVGLQNFQWGPAELANPSNPIFRDIALDKGRFFETRGKALIRFNYSPTMQTSLIAMVEPLDSQKERSSAEGDFKQRGLLKLEYTDQSMMNYLGVVIASTARERPRYGSYGHVEWLPGLSTYFDLSIEHGSQAWYPQLDLGQGLAIFDQRWQDDEKLYLTSVYGVRYTWENGWDLRLEGYNSDLGYSNLDQNQARQVVALSPIERTVKLYRQPGLLLLGSRNVYGSLRIPEWGPRNALTTYFRYLRSLDDESSKGQMILDYDVNEHVVMSASLAGSFGRKDTEFARDYRALSYIAAAWNW